MEHYTAVIEVTKTSTAPASPVQYQQRNEQKAPTREVQDVARIVVRAPELATLQTKVAAHVALIEG